MNMSKNEVLAILGSDRLVVASNTKWCWFSKDYGAHPNCAVNYGGSCPCSVSFSEEGLVSGQDNIKADLLDLFSF
jgi:hypothetical protein